MTNIVADDVLGRFARQQHDWFERVKKGSLSPEEVAHAVQNIIDIGHPFKHDKRKDGWVLLEDVGFSPPIDLAKIELVPFLKAGEGFINGEEMVRRAREFRATLGQCHAEYLMEHQQEIPKEFRKYYVVFAGTIWRRPDGSLGMACLSWSGGQWLLSFLWLESDWGSIGRLARSRE